MVPLEIAAAPCRRPDTAPGRVCLSRYPLFFKGASFCGRFNFTNTHTLVEHHLEEVESLLIPSGQ